MTPDSICYLLFCVFFTIPSLVMMSLKAFAPGSIGRVSLIYPTLTNPYFLETLDSLNNTVISEISDKIGEIHQDYVAFAYFLVFGLVTYTRAFILTMQCCVDWCSPHKLNNPEEEPITEEEKELLKMESATNKAKLRKFFSHYSAYMNIWRPLYRPILMLLLSILCGVTDPFILAKLVVITLALETVILFLSRTVLQLLVYHLIYSAIWFLFGYAAYRYPNKLVVVVAGLGFLETTVHVVSEKAQEGCKAACLYLRWVDPLCEICFNFVLLITCYLGYFFEV